MSTQQASIQSQYDIRSQLFRPRVGQGNERFVPADKIEAFTSREVIVRVLTNANVPNPEQLANKVLHHQAKKLFLLAATCKRIEWLVDWLNHPNPFGDNDLPVELDEDDAIHSIHSVPWQPEPRQWPTGSELDDDANTLFEVRQWRLLAPIFTAAKFHYELPSRAPLPFLRKVRHQIGGWFSIVYEVELHPAHQQVVTPEIPRRDRKAALKVMKMTEIKWFLREMKVLEAIQHIEHPHLVRPIASYKRGDDDKGCFLFPWADGGNLKTFWARDENQMGVVSLQGGNAHNMMVWTLKQMLGLCSALAELHASRPSHVPSSNETVHCRHGDIKPENILVFRRGESDVLCIADMGLGKFHAKATEYREAGNIYTDTKTGTTRYLPPEFNSKKQIPRIHDIWSLGCLFLEFIIWAAWGNDGLDKFIQLDITEFWQRRSNIREVHESVREWIRHMRNTFRLDKQETALGDILEMVRCRMLVLEAGRKTSEEIRVELEGILTRAERSEEYRLSAALRSRIQQYGLPEARSVSQNEAREEYKSSELSELEDRWQTHTDNDFAQNLRTLLKGASKSSHEHDWLVKPPPSSSETVLCAACSTVDLWQPDLHIEREVQYLTENSPKCGFCRLIQQSLNDLHLLENASNVSLRRDGPTLEAMPSKKAVLTIYADPASEDVDDRIFQVGHPMLPTAGSREQFTLFKEWLRLCPQTHKHVTMNPKTTDTLPDDRPTRVIDVISLSSPFVRLLDGKDMMSSEYLALSHRWGDKPEHHLGRTLRDNYDSRYNKIEWDELPRNFQDAITITRNLGLQYLWIDSICIIQRDSEDWNRESMRMEQVYSNARCVLAASSSTSSIDGFLERPTASRPFIALQSRSGDAAYIGKNIDNFRGDVDEAILNTRGWTLQERALARRTIHFTKNQAYFECSNGVQCESLTRLTNGRSSLLGDSDFPSSVVSRYKDGRVMLIQTLYHQYSKRRFSERSDRPIAILGLEKRLTSAFSTRGGYGVFQSFLERTLLWKRDDETSSLTPIKFPPRRNVPTWSWMAYDGAISYVQADFDKVDWTNEYSSSFDSGSGALGKWHWEADGTNRPPILGLARVRELDSSKDSSELLERISFDTPGHEQRPQDLRCVVIGKAKPGDSIGPFILNCYVLVVKASSDENLRGAYLRVGAGELTESEIIWDRYEAGNLH